MATGRKLTGLNPLAYMGTEPYAAPQVLIDDRAPTTADYTNVNIGALWLVTSPLQVWMLNNIVGTTATWNKLYPVSGGAGGAEHFPCDTGTADVTDNEINIVGGDGNIQTEGSGNNVTTSLKSTISVVTDLKAADKVTAGGKLSSTLGDLTITSGGLNATGTVTLDDLNPGVVMADATGKLSASRGTADGQLLISAGGGDPAWAAPTSSDSTLTITPGANSIDLKRTGGGGSAGLAFMAIQTEQLSGEYIPITQSEVYETLGSITKLTILFDTTGGFYEGSGTGQHGTGSYFEAQKAGTYIFTLSVGLNSIPIQSYGMASSGPAIVTPDGTFSFSPKSLTPITLSAYLTIGQKVYFGFFAFPDVTIVQPESIYVVGLVKHDMGDFYSTWVCGHYIG